MANFNEAFDYMIQYEGDRFTDIPNDLGGATKFGISERFISSLKDDDFLPHILTTGIIIWNNKIMVLEVNFGINNYIKSLTTKLAKLIYQKYFWLPIYDAIDNQDIANYIFDMTVQHGKKKASELTQRAANAAFNDSKIKIDKLKVDGVFGGNTYDAIDSLQRWDAAAGLKIALIAVRESLFRCIVARDPSQKVFLDGWLKRAYGEKL